MTEITYKAINKIPNSILGTEYVCIMGSASVKFSASEGYRFRLEGNIIHHEPILEDSATGNSADCAGTHNVASSASLGERHTKPNHDGDEVKRNECDCLRRPDSEGIPASLMLASPTKLIAEIEALKCNGKSCREIAHEVHNDAIEKALDIIRNHYAAAPKAWLDAREKIRAEFERWAINESEMIPIRSEQNPERYAVTFVQFAYNGFAGGYQAALATRPDVNQKLVEALQNGFDSMALSVLRNNQRQLDNDGITVGVSREALGMAIAYIDKTEILVEQALTKHKAGKSATPSPSGEEELTETKTIKIIRDSELPKLSKATAERVFVALKQCGALRIKS